MRVVMKVDMMVGKKVAYLAVMMVVMMVELK